MASFLRVHVSEFRLPICVIERFIKIANSVAKYWSYTEISIEALFYVTAAFL